MKLLNLNILDTKFSSTIVSSVDNPLNVFNLIASPVYTDLRNDIYESKLYHSDYYQPKFVYDSFGFVFALEKIDEDNFAPSSKFTFEFIMTSTINSKFMFKFPEYILSLSTEDYDNILSISRNNEAPIYSSAYTTYLMSAFRYDLKALQLSTTQRSLQLGASAINTGMGMVENAFDLNYWAMGQKSMGLGSLFANFVMNSNKEINSFQANIESLKNQAVSVSGSDDLDLLEAYSDNRAKLVEYRISDRAYEMVADLFYYYGYSTNEMKIPSLNTRYWFNYIQCELELKDTGSNISQELIENLKQRFANGITILHHHTTWNFDLDKENWEVSLL